MNAERAAATQAVADQFIDWWLERDEDNFEPSDMRDGVLRHLSAAYDAGRRAGDQEAMSREGAAVNKVLYDAALWREHDGWVTYKCNVEQMPRYAMLEAYGSPPIEKAIQAALDAAYAEGLRDAAKQVPTNWCDELLSGKTVSKLPWNSSNIEQLLRGVQQRIERLAQQAEGGAHGTSEQG